MGLPEGPLSASGADCTQPNSIHNSVPGVFYNGPSSSGMLTARAGKGQQRAIYPRDPYISLSGALGDSLRRPSVSPAFGAFWINSGDGE